MVRLDERLKKIKGDYVDYGSYFVINRGCQYGKTTNIYHMILFSFFDFGEGCRKYTRHAALGIVCLSWNDTKATKVFVFSIYAKEEDLFYEYDECLRYRL